MWAWYRANAPVAVPPRPRGGASVLARLPEVGLAYAQWVNPHCWWSEPPVNSNASCSLELFAMLDGCGLEPSSAFFRP